MANSSTEAHEEVDSEDDDEDEIKTVEIRTTLPQPRSAAYAEFLHFLELGCSGSPADGYPSVLIVISTLPSSVSAP